MLAPPTEVSLLWPRADILASSASVELSSDERLCKKGFGRFTIFTFTFMGDDTDLCRGFPKCFDACGFGGGLSESDKK